MSSADFFLRNELAKRGVLGSRIARSSMRFCLCCTPEFRGRICLRNSEASRPLTTGFGGGRNPASGIWQRIFEALIARLHKAGDIDFELWCVDGTVIRAHRVASGARKAKLSREENALKQALGRSRGGFSTKLHFLTDGQGIPIGITATPGQRNEAPEFQNVMQACLIKTFRKANRPTSLAADKAYSSKAIRDYIAKLEVEDVIPTRSNETKNDGFNKSTYRMRNIVERAIGWIKEHRRIATRYEKLVENYLAMIYIAVIRM